MIGPPSHYRFVLSAAPPACLGGWFPELELTRDRAGRFVLQGPVVDASQLAGIISAICHRDGEILEFERMDPPADAGH